MERRHATGFVRQVKKRGVQFNHLVERPRQRAQFADRVCFAIGDCGVNELKRVGVFFNGIPHLFAAFFDLSLDVA